MTTEVVVLLPGIMGSTLYDGDDCVWPGKPMELLLPYKRMAQLMKPRLVVKDVIRSYLISNQYGALVSSLNTCGFRENLNPPTLAACPYDWRRDNAEAAIVLADRLDSLFDDHGGQVDFDLVAHSMGGLVSRYYLESALFNGRKAFSSVKRLITMGTPHHGAPLALFAALGNEKRLFLDKAQVKQLADDANFPSLYQLMPPHGEPYLWDQAPAARFSPIDPYDPRFAEQAGLSPQNLAAARAFHSRLDLAKRPGHVRYFFFVGTQHVTITEARHTKLAADVRIDRIEREDGGDGTVPTWSGSHSRVQGAAVSGEHGELYKSGDLLQVLATLLGKQGVLAAALQEAELTLRDPVVLPDDETRAVLTLAQPAERIEGELRVSRMMNAEGNRIDPPAALPAMGVEYHGAPVDRISIQLHAPDLPGAYKVEFVAAVPAVATAGDELLVQRP
jgi:pimeloyl-ACP methyl ester carboxylesterase